MLLRDERLIFLDMNPRTGDPVLSMRDILVRQVKGTIPKTLFLAGRCGVHEAVETSSSPKKDAGDYGDTPFNMKLWGHSPRDQLLWGHSL
jgi:hypothetical protein